MPVTYTCDNAPHAAPVDDVGIFNVQVFLNVPGRALNQFEAAFVNNGQMLPTKYLCQGCRLRFLTALATWGAQ